MAEDLVIFEGIENVFLWLPLSFLAIVGTCCNGLIVFLFLTSKELRTPMNTLFVNLTISDFIVSLFGTFVSAVYTMTRTVMQQGMCEWYGFITFLGGTGDAWSLTFIALERYLTVARPCGVGSTTFMRSGIALAITWAISVVVAGLPLVGLSAYTLEGAGYWCSINWEQKNFSTELYTYFIFLMSYFCPIIIIIFAYTVVVMKIRAVAKTGASDSSLKAQKQVTNQSMIMVSLFVLAWTPYAIVCLVVAFGTGNPFSPKVAVLPPIFSKFSFCVNPFIYVAMNKQFRAAFVKKILNGKDPFGKKEEKVKDDASYNATMGKTEGQTKGDAGATNKVAPAPEA